MGRGKEQFIESYWLERIIKMKKILTILLSIMMCLGMPLVAFADESDFVVSNTQETFVSNEDTSLASVQSMVEYISYYQDAQMCNGKASQTFTVSSGYNLKLIMASTQTVRVRLYNMNTGAYLVLDNGSKYVTVIGGAPAATYALKSSCPSGTYRLEFYSDYSTTFYAIYSVVGTTYV